MSIFLRVLSGLASLAIISAMIFVPTLTPMRYASFSAHYDMIFNQEGPVDVVFFGTSRAMRAFYAKELMPLVEEKLGRKVIGYDLSYASRTSDISYVMLRDLLERRQVRLVVSEYSIEGNDRFHTLFPQIATYGDVFNAPAQGFDHIRIPAGFVRSKLSLMMGLTNFRRSIPSEKEPAPAVTTDTTAPSLAHPEQIATRAATRATEPETLALSDERDFVQHRYMDRLIDLANAHGAKTVFMYLPAITQGGLAGGEAERFESRFGKPLFEMPRLEPTDYSDGKHVGWMGLEKVNPYFAGVIADALK